MKSAYAVSTIFVLLMAAAVIYLGYESGKLGPHQIGSVGRRITFKPAPEAAAK